MNTDRIAKVESFIREFKGTDKDVYEKTFYNGWCYWFAIMLVMRFKGEMWFNPQLVHFAAMIDGILYDIYGMVEAGVSPITGKYQKEDDCWVEWGKYQEEHPEESKGVVETCIKKV